MTNLIKEFKALKNDQERWEWLIHNKDNGIKVILDNDMTSIVDKSIDNEETYSDDTTYHSNFEGYIGCDQGAIDLLKALGIESERC
jgi:hypothetical protein